MERVKDRFAQIPNRQLTTQDLPVPHSCWSQISRFSWSYGSYVGDSFSNCAETARKCEKAYSTKQSLSHFPLADLRTALFFEQRRYHHFGWAPDDPQFGSNKEMDYIWNLIEAIRSKVKSGRIN